jgi:hypothetical protein
VAAVAEQEEPVAEQEEPVADKEEPVAELPELFAELVVEDIVVDLFVEKLVFHDPALTYHLSIYNNIRMRLFHIPSEYEMDIYMVI